MISHTPTMQALRRRYGFDSLAAREQLVQLAEPIAGRHVLDIGTGSGSMAEVLRQNELNVISVDILPATLRQVSRQALVQDSAPSVFPVRFVCADAGNLPFVSDAFDAVFSFESMHHVGDCHRTIDEMLRVCAPGGVVAIADLNDRGFEAVRAVNLQAGRLHEENECRTAEVGQALRAQGYRPERYSLDFVTVFVIRALTKGRRRSVSQHQSV